MQGAFAALRGYACGPNHKLSEVARAVIAGGSEHTPCSASLLRPADPVVTLYRNTPNLIGQPRRLV